ncbi:MAG: hypothetical protein LBR75_01440 [Prevotellaceae bacterium]|nr:hypothetical protein [Prevotellaceae bacterium]
MHSLFPTLQNSPATPVNTAFEILTGGGKLLDIKRLSAFKIFFRPVFGGASLAVATLEATHSDRNCAGFFCVSLAGKEKMLAGREDYFAGRGKIFDGKEGCFAVKEKLFAGREDYFAGKEKLFAGKKDCFAGKTKRFALRRNFFSLQNKLIANP